MSASFKHTSKQSDAIKVLSAAEEAALYGGSRSGKTFIILRAIVIRAAKVKSRHLIARFRFNHAKTSIWKDTLPKVLELCFPNLAAKWNNSDHYITLSNGSEIWLGGVDDKERVEKILGNEYSTIYLNECSQIAYEAVTMLQTRLAENSGLALRMWYDFNPPTKKHWTHRYFIEGKDPEDLKDLPEKIPYLVMNPGDNIDNLPPTYMKRLERLPKRQRQRFLQGLFTLDVEGALWNADLINLTRTINLDAPERTVVAVDPSVTANHESDEVGIIVASMQTDVFINDYGERVDGYSIDADYSGKMTTQTWAMRLINVAEQHDADCIIAEVNQGGDLVENTLRLNGYKGRFKAIHAHKGKALRAEPIVALYEQNRVCHADDLDELETEMTEWVPLNSKVSPNRLDAAVYAITELAGEDDNFADLLNLAVNGGA